MDRVKPLKIQDSGDEQELYPQSIDQNEDAMDARGIVLQNDTSDDDTVVVSRNASNDMTFKDGVVSGTKTLTDLLAASGITAEAHKTLRHGIHFIDGGPAEGFASGAYRETTGTVFPTSVIWYEDDTKAKKIVEKTITWSSTAPVPTTIVWKMYDTDGSTVLATITDTFTYASTIFESSRVRTIA